MFRSAVCFSTGFAATGIVLVCSSSHVLRRMGARIAFLAVGLLLGAHSLIERDQDRAFVCLPLTSVSEFDVLLLDDALRTRSGSVLYRGRLLRVSDGNQTIAPAAGTTVVTGGKVLYPWGTHLHVEVGLQRPDGPGADWIAHAGPDRIRVATKSAAHFVLRNRARDWIERRLRGLRAEDSALFMALFLGAREDLSGEESYFFRRAGAIHLLALSGFHLGILSFLLVALLAPVLGKVRATAVAAVVLVGYLFVAGPKISLLRAVIMFSLLGVCRLARLRVRGVDLLALTFLLCLIIWPASLSSLSFQLSFLALAGILSLTPVFERPMTGYLPKTFRSPFAASMSANLLTAPVLASRFGLLYPVGVASGLLLTPLVTAFFWCGLAYVFVPLPEPVSGIVAKLVETTHTLLIATVEFFARANPIRLSHPGDVLAVTSSVIALLQLRSLIRFVRGGGGTKRIQ